MSTIGTVDLSAIATAIMDRKGPGFIDAVFYNDQLLKLLRLFGLDEPDPKTVDGDDHKWDVAYDSNGSVETYDEGDPLPAAGHVPFIEASLGFTNIQGVLRISNMALDAMKNGGYFGAIDSQFPLIQEAIKDARTAAFLGSGAKGILNMIAATGTYAGITRGSAAYWESTVDTSTSSQTIAAHRTHLRSIRGAEKSGHPGLILTTRANADIYAALGGTTVTAGAMRRVDIGGGAPRLDYGYKLSGLTLDDIPIVAIDDLTANTWLTLDMSEQNPIRHRVIRPMNVVPHHREGDTVIYHVTTRSQLVIENPKTCGKFTALAS